MKRTIITALLAFFVGSTNPLAASMAAKDTTKTKQYKLTVSTTVADHLSHEPIDSLRATLHRAADSSFVDTVHVERYYWGEGSTYLEFTIREAGKYLLRLEAKGYQTRYVSFEIAKIYKRETFRELKRFYMRRDMERKGATTGDDSITVMNEVVVKATKLQFVMRGDTLVYYADEFSMAEGSMLSDLIKQFQSVELKENGEIFVNGRKVDVMMLNGKDFFDKDRELLLENMPAYIVKECPVYERTPKKVKGTPLEKSTPKEYVMDVRVKPDYNTAWLGNVEGGVGVRFGSQEGFGVTTKAPPFLGRAFAMRYDANSRIALYANVNNLSDYRTPGEKGEWSPLRQSESMTTTYSVGANGFYNKNDRLEYQGSADFFYTEENTANHTSGETFLAGGNTYNRSFYNRQFYNYHAKTEHELTLKKTETLWDTFKNLFFNYGTSFDYQNRSYNTNSASTTLDEDVSAGWGKAWMDSLMTPNAGYLLRQHALNRNTTRGYGTEHLVNWENTSYFCLFPAHNDHIVFLIGADYSYSDEQKKLFDHYLVDYPKSAEATDFRNRYRPDFDRTHDVGVSPQLAFTLDNDGHHTLWFRHAYNYKNTRSNKDIYLLNQIEEWADGGKHSIGLLPSTEEMLLTLDADNSQHSHKKTTTNTPEIQYDFFMHSDSTGSLNALSASLSLPICYEKLDYWQGSQIDTLATRRTTSISASLYFRHDHMKTNRYVRANYETSVSQPSMRSMFDICNDSDPLNITYGNPDLRPSRNHSFYASYGEKLRRTLVNAMFQINVTQDAIATAKLYDTTTGVRRMKSQNINGNWNTYTSAEVDFPLIRSERIRLKQSVSHGYTHSVDLMNEYRSVVKTNNFDDELSLTWRPNDKLNFSAKSDLHYQRSNSDQTDFTTINVFDFDYGLTAQFELPWDFQIATDLTMYSRRGYSDNTMNTNDLVWNARITKRLMHGNLLLHLDGFDMLGQLSNVRHSINAQGRTETFYNVIPSYALFHVSWRLNKKPKSERLSKNE